MTDISNIEALAFDYYGTIADKQGLAEEIDTVFPGKGKPFTQIWFATIQRYCFQNGMMKRFIPWSKLTKAAFKIAAHDMDMQVGDDLRDTWIDADTRLPAYAEASISLVRLAARYRLYVLSMGSPRMIEQSQKSAGIDGHFTSILSTETDRVYKPSAAAYEIGVREIGLSKDKIGFVSGNSFDVIGAGNFGYPTIWVRRYGQPLDDFGVFPDIVVGDLLEMAEKLDA